MFPFLKNSPLSPLVRMWLHPYPGTRGAGKCNAIPGEASVPYTERKAGYWGKIGSFCTDLPRYWRGPCLLLLVSAGLSSNGHYLCKKDQPTRVGEVAPTRKSNLSVDMNTLCPCEIATRHRHELGNVCSVLLWFSFASSRHFCTMDTATPFPPLPRRPPLPRLAARCVSGHTFSKLPHL